MQESGDVQDAIGLLSHAVTVATELEWSDTPCARRLREARAEAQRLAKEFVAQKRRTLRLQRREKSFAARFDC
jgi:hypothetical protein